MVNGHPKCLFWWLLVDCNAKCVLGWPKDCIILCSKLVFVGDVLLNYERLLYMEWSFYLYRFIFFNLFIHIILTSLL